jgi:tRNA (guanine37-N1)-methyltransferase
VFLITFISIFPEIFPGALQFGLTGRSFGHLWDFRVINPRDFSSDKHKKVDDSPFGGGAGMIMNPVVVHSALKAAMSLYRVSPVIVVMSPAGKLFNQNLADRLMERNLSGLIIVCGRYEGIDQRVIDFWKERHGMIEICIGDYILFGGEIPGMVVADTCLRIIPGIMNNTESIKHESFSEGMLESPQYTRPLIWNDMQVPDVLTSGHHKKIAIWRKKQAVEKTKQNRPDLFLRGRCLP